MNLNILTKKAYNVCEWFSKIVMLNILWIIFTLIGLGIFGIAPATTALFTVVRKWVLEESDFSLFKTFTNTYKREFLQSNYLGLLLFLIGGFLIYDFRLILAIGGTIKFVIGVPLFVIIFGYLVILIYLFPVYVHFNIKFMDYFKYAFVIGFLNLHITISIIFLIALLCSMLIFLPGFIPFSSVSVFSIIIMFGAKSAFKRIEKKQEKYNVKKLD